MSILDLLLDLVETFGVEPRSGRGLVITSSICSLALLSLTIWLLASSANPNWRLGTCVGSALVGAGGTLVATLHLRRDHSDRLLAALCLVIDVLAIVVPAAAIIGM